MKKIFVFAFVVAVLLSAVFVMLYLKNIDESVNMYSENYISNLIVKTLYETLDEYLSLKGIDYFDVVKIDKDINGNVKTLTIDSGMLNKIRSETTVILTEKLENLCMKDFNIPIGNVISSRILSGMGPKIKIKIIPLGFVSSEMKNEFYSVGINQSKHNISIIYNFTLSVLAPFSSASTTHSATITIAESIIIGDVPNTNITVGSGFSETIKYYAN